MRDFEWIDIFYVVVKEDGSFVGVFCLSWDEAREFSIQHENLRIFALNADCDQVWEV